jgi:hypothetical protein
MACGSLPLLASNSTVLLDLRPAAEPVLEHCNYVHLRLNHLVRMLYLSWVADMLKPHACVAVCCLQLVDD